MTLLSTAVAALSRAAPEARETEERLRIALAEARADRVELTLRAEVLVADLRNADRPRHLRPGERSGSRRPLRDGAPGSVAVERDATAQSLATMGLTRPARKPLELKRL